MNKHQILAEYANYFTGTPLLVNAPGRINLIGEHTDYNHGFVMPAAINKSLFLAMNKSDQPDTVKVRSYDYDQEETFILGTSPRPFNSWRSYVQAIFQELEARSKPLSGFNCVFGSDIPVGAGMSSSAALCCGFISGVNRLFNWELSKLEIAQIAQAAEHRIGAHVGLMDQFAVMHGKKDHVIQLDCLDYSYEYNPLKLKDLSLVLINSNVKHELVDSEYNDRRASCEKALSQLQQLRPEINTLRDVNMNDLENADFLDPTDLKRVQFVLHENYRVKLTSQALKGGRFQEVGKLLYQSHQGLSQEYQVSCPELDLLVDLTKQEQGVLGARMMGGGFGGCSINLVRHNELDDTILRIMEQYEQQTKITPESYMVSIEDGVKLFED